MAEQGAYSRVALTVDLAAIAANLARLRARAPAPEIAPVIKADAYGLGAVPIARLLAQEGCRTFFLASLEECLDLRAARALPEAATLYLLNGLAGAAPSDLLAAGALPVLNSRAEIAQWTAEARRRGAALPACIHIDTGMNRLGLAPAEAEALAHAPEALRGLTPLLIMSHLASADSPEDPLNERQRLRFEALRRGFPPHRASLANSAGMLIGPAYGLDMVRPGIALYGGNPLTRGDNPFLPVIRLDAPVLQVRSVDKGESVGYAATHRLGGPARIATIAAGYADGYMRALSGRGRVTIGERAVPVVGRVSMDLLALDVSALPDDAVRPGTRVELIGPTMTIDAVAAAAGTLAYELLTRIGPRALRRYTDTRKGGEPS